MRTKQISSHYGEVFFMGLIIALSFILPYIIIDKGIFLFYGDFCVQQVPFIQLMHDSIKSGNIFWSWNSDLGSNFIGSYTFYDLGSPFFWLTLPFPSWLVPYTIGPILCLKIATAALTSYAYIERFVKTKELAILGGLLYAFSSYSIYDIFFNHFHDAMACFPLLLIALEELMINRRKGVFALTVLLNVFINYFFFVGEVIFLLIYWIIRSLSDDWKPSLHTFFTAAFESILGVALSAVLLIPSVLQVGGNTRLTNHLSGWNLLVYYYVQRLPDIIHSVFFPQDLPAFPNFFPNSGANWSSVAAWLPLVSMTGVIAYLVSRKGSWLKRIIITCFAFALIPGLNGLFVLLVDSYYGRWFYMPVLMMSLATVLALDDPTIDFMRGFRMTVFFTAAFVAAVGLVPKFGDDKKFIQLGLEDYPDRFWIYVAIVAAGLALTAVLYQRHRNDKIKLANYFTIAFTVIVCIFGNYFIAMGKTFGYNTTWYENVAINGSSQIKLEKPYNYRVDVLDGMDNQAMFWKIPTIQAFNSVISASTMEFYPEIGVTRDVASRPSTSYPGIRPLLSVKYLFDAHNSTSISMPGWSKMGTQLGFTVWKNNNYIPFGFTFTKYITQTQFDQSSSKDRLLLKALLLSSSQIKKYSGILQQLNTTDTDVDYSDSAMTEDCRDRNQYTCTNFSRDNTGFSASITLNSKNLVFFSVPYDAGWTATVNGKPVTVEKVDIGFMAVLCPAGTSSIRFNYMTPGLKTGALVSGLAVVVLVVYLILFLFVFKKRKKGPDAPAPLESGKSGESFLLDFKPESEQPDDPAAPQPGLSGPAQPPEEDAEPKDGIVSPPSSSAEETDDQPAESSGDGRPEAGQKE